MVHDLNFALDDPLHAMGEIACRNAVADDVVFSVDRALPEAGEVQNRFAQRLARNGAGVDAHAARHLPPIDDRDTLTELGSRDRSLLARRPATYDDEVVIV